MNSYDPKDPKDPQESNKISDYPKIDNQSNKDFSYDPLTGEIEQIDPEGFINGHEYIDLGLPSGLMWASCNIGAQNPEDFGEYFAWGEIESKYSFEKGNSPTVDKDKDWLQKNGYLNLNGNLTLEHDVAHVKWGGSWRMPTKAEIEELINNTTTKLTIQGRWFESKTNGNKIFLPFASYKYWNTISIPWITGKYWSSTPICDEHNWNSNVLDITCHNTRARFFDRWWACTVRPVSDYRML